MKIKHVILIMIFIHLIFIALILYTVLIFSLSFFFKTSLFKSSLVYLTKKSGYYVEYDNLDVCLNHRLKISVDNLGIISNKDTFIKSKKLILDTELSSLVKGTTKKTLILENYSIALKINESDLMKTRSKEKTNCLLTNLCKNIDLKLDHGGILVNLYDKYKVSLDKTWVNLIKEQDAIQGFVNCDRVSMISDLYNYVLSDDINLNITTKERLYLFEGKIKNMSSESVNKALALSFPIIGLFDVDFTLSSDIQYIPQGKLKVTSKDGKIIKASILEKILSIVNMTEIIFGNSSDLMNKYISYKFLSINSSIEKNKIKFEEIVLNCRSFNMSGYGSLDTKSNFLDIIIFISPFKTVDRILSKIPIINYMLNDSLISIPLKLEGKLDHLKVRPVPVKTLAEKSIKFIERILTAPIKVLDGSIKNS